MPAESNTLGIWVMNIRKSSPSKERGIQDDGGYKLPPSLCAAEIWFVPEQVFSGQRAGGRFQQIPLRPGPHAMIPMKPEYKAMVSHPSTHLDESACC